MSGFRKHCFDDDCVCGCGPKPYPPPRPRPQTQNALVSGPLERVASINAVVVKVQNVGNTTADVTVKLINEDVCNPRVAACDTFPLAPGCTGQQTFNTELGTISNFEIAVCGNPGADLRASVTAFTGFPGQGDVRFIVPAGSMLPDRIGFCNDNRFRCP